MSLSSYIRELLPEHDTVIIPGLGAFISSYMSAEVDEKSGKMIPPSKQISFEPRIRNNDGLLAGKIAEDDGISLTEAYRKLELEREEILYQLDKGESVFLEQIGELYYNKNREINFYSSEQNIFLPDTYGLEAGSINEPEDIPEEELNPDDAAEKSVLRDPFEEQPHEIYTGASLSDSSIPPRKRNRAWWLILFLIPLLGAAFYIITKDTREQPSVGNATVREPISEEIVSPADTAVTDSIPIPEKIMEIASSEIIDSTGFLVPDSTKFYLITGSYEEFINADKYFQRLKADGYKPFHLGKHGSFYLVGIDTFSNATEAFGQQYNYLDKYPESGAWIFIPGKKYISRSEQNDTIARQF